MSSPQDEDLLRTLVTDCFDSAIDTIQALAERRNAINADRFDALCADTDLPREVMAARKAVESFLFQLLLLAEDDPRLSQLAQLFDGADECVNRGNLGSVLYSADMDEPGLLRRFSQFGSITDDLVDRMFNKDRPFKGAD